MAGRESPVDEAEKWLGKKVALHWQNIPRTHAAAAAARLTETAATRTERSFIMESVVGAEGFVKVRLRKEAATGGSPTTQEAL